MKKQFGFSFVELIISITIVILLAVIGMSLNSGYKEKATNGQVIANIQTLSNAFSLYKEENKTLPLPMGNKNYFLSNSQYSHDENGAYGVHGFVRENIMPKKYLSILPLDSRTNQYFAYGKTLETPFFELAGVISDAGEFLTKVLGDYSGETGPKNLIREYNGSSFVFNTSSNHFPYNPNQKSMNARFGNVSGTVTINNQIIPPSDISLMTLVSGDTIKVSQGGSVDIYFSDGSISSLGSNSSESEISLSYLDYKDNGFFTKIQIALRIGTLWTKATRLDSESEFQVSTSDTTAAVRGTVFGVTKDTLSPTKIEVRSGSVSLYKDSLKTQPLMIPGSPSGNNVLEVVTNYPRSIQITADGYAITAPITQNLVDNSFGNNIVLKLDGSPTYSGGVLQRINLVQDSRFKYGDILSINGRNSALPVTTNDISYPIPIYIQNSISFDPLPSTTDIKVCRQGLDNSETICTQTLSVPSYINKPSADPIGGGVGEISDSAGVEILDCKGIKIGENCIENRLSNTEYTLVGVADYTKNDDIFTYNGGRIDGNYSGSGRDSTGYDSNKVASGSSPSSGKKGIVYDLDSLLHTDEDFIIEFVVSGKVLKDSATQYLFFQNNNLSLQYLGSYGKFKYLSTSIIGTLSTSIEGTLPYILQLKKTSSTNISIKVLNPDTKAILFSGSISPLNTLTTQDKFNTFYIGGKFDTSTNNWSSPVKGLIYKVFLYKKIKLPASREINTTNAVLLKKGTVTNLPPTINIGSAPVTVMEGESTYTNLNISDSDGQITSYLWKENGNIISLAELSVGTHLLTLTVTDDKGGQQSANISVTVKSKAVQVSGDGCGECPYGVDEKFFTKRCKYIFDDKFHISDDDRVICSRFGGSKEWEGWYIPQ